MLRFEMPLDTLSKVLVPFAQERPPIQTISRWLHFFQIGARESGRIQLSADELAVLTLFAWLRLGTPCSVQAAKGAAKKALHLMGANEPKVLAVLRLNRDGAEVAISTTPVQTNLSTFVFDVTAYRDCATRLMKEGRFAELAGLLV